MEHSTRSSLDSTSDQEEEEDDFAGILFPPPEDEDEKVAQRLLVNETVAATSEEWRRRREGAVMDTGGQEAWIYMLIEFNFHFPFLLFFLLNCPTFMTSLSATLSPLTVMYALCLPALLTADPHSNTTAPRRTPRGTGREERRRGREVPARGNDSTIS